MTKRASRPPLDTGHIPDRAGAYVLEFDLTCQLRVRVGRLGQVVLQPGQVRYYGSARGPGGLRARVARHLRPPWARRMHWHVDALTERLPVTRVLLFPGQNECSLLRRDLAAGWEVAVAGFGSSDCRACPAHLLWIRAWPFSPGWCNKHAGQAEPI